MPKDSTKRSVLNYYAIDSKKNVEWIETLEDFENIFLKNYVTNCIVPSDGNKKKADYVFRGLSSPEQKYSKITTVHYKRKYNSPLLCDTGFVNALNLELMYVRKFQQNAPQVGVSNNSALDLVAMAQHNLLRTRLIDWTRSPLVATLFALHSTPEEKTNRKTSGKSQWKKYYLVLAADCKENILAQGLPIPTHGIERGSIQFENYLIYGEMLKYLTEVYDSDDDDLRKEYFADLLAVTNTKYMLRQAGATVQELNNSKIVTKLSNYLKQDKIFFLETNYSNTRIAAQRGLFQISVLPSKDYIDKCFKNIDLIFINEDAREDILEYCNRLGINNYALMPDKQSAALEINKKADEELKNKRRKTNEKK